MGLLLSRSYLHCVNNSPQSAFYTDRLRTSIATWGGGGGSIRRGGGEVRILQNRTEIRLNTAQSNVRKPQIANRETAWYCKTAILHRKIKISEQNWITANHYAPSPTKPAHRAWYRIIMKSIISLKGHPSLLPHSPPRSGSKAREMSKFSVL